MAFHKGKSGNPAGRPRGARGKSNIVLEYLRADNIGAVAGALALIAKNNEIVTLHICTRPRTANAACTSADDRQPDAAPHGESNGTKLRLLFPDLAGKNECRDARSRNGCGDCLRDAGAHLSLYSACSYRRFTRGVVPHCSLQ
jgi:hypothetical protein